MLVARSSRVPRVYARDAVALAVPLGRGTHLSTRRASSRQTQALDASLGQRAFSTSRHVKSANEQEQMLQSMKQPLELIPEWLNAPYPTSIIPLQNEKLRAEVFRPTVHDRTVDPTLPAIYNHTGLEHRGDALADLLVAEISVGFFERGETGYRILPNAVTKGRLCWSITSIGHFSQFKIGADGVDISNLSEDRLADNFEAYLYALFLDQGLDVAARWFCPLIIKKIYAEAASLEMKLSKPVYGPIESDTVEEVQTTGVIGRLKSLLYGPAHRASPRNRRRPPPRKVTYENYNLPHWQVACSDGADCKRTACYFQHPNKDENYPWAQPGSFPDPFAQLPAQMTVEERRLSYRQKMEQLIDDKLAIERIQTKKDVVVLIEDHTISAVDKIVDPWIAKVKKLDSTVETVQKRYAETKGELKAVERTVAALKNDTASDSISDKGLAAIVNRIEHNAAGKISTIAGNLDNLTFRQRKIEDDISASALAASRVRFTESDSSSAKVESNAAPSTVDLDLLAKRVESMALLLKDRSKDFSSQLLREAHRTSQLDDALRSLQQQVEKLEKRNGEDTEVAASPIDAMLVDREPVMMDGAAPGASAISDESLHAMLSKMRLEKKDSLPTPASEVLSESEQVVEQSGTLGEKAADAKSESSSAGEKGVTPIKQSSGRKKTKTQPSKQIKKARKAATQAAQAAAKVRKAERAAAQAALRAAKLASEAEKKVETSGNPS